MAGAAATPAIEAFAGTAVVEKSLFKHTSSFKLRNCMPLGSMGSGKTVRMRMLA